MKLLRPNHTGPADADQRRAAAPVVCYPIDTLSPPPMALYADAKAQGWEKIDSRLMPPRDAKTFSVPAGCFFRITSVEGPQIGDLNLWNAGNMTERFYSGKTRAMHGTHLSTGDRLWTSFPYLRPMATITDDSLDWYGFDADGASVHDVIGTRCDPYTAFVLNQTNYHYCCHSNLCRAIADQTGRPIDQIEADIHDVLNVFMCTGFTADTHQYFMKATPVRPGDYLEFFAEIDLMGALSACPGGDGGQEHSSDTVPCFPLLVEVFRPTNRVLADGGWQSPPVNGYDRTHGL